MSFEIALASLENRQLIGSYVSESSVPWCSLTGKD